MCISYMHLVEDLTSNKISVFFGTEVDQKLKFMLTIMYFSQ